MATNTYVALASQTLATSASSVTFSSIPAGYTDLQIVINANNTTNGSNCKIQFNGDTGSNYSTTWMEGNGSSASSGRETGATSSFIYYNGNASTYNWSTAVVSVQNYSNATTYKTAISRFGNQAQTGAYVDLWRSTSAVTSITLNALTQNFQAGSTFNLYGIAAASVGAKATGGTIYSDSSYYYHVFAANGTFTPSQSISADVLVVAGGGGGGSQVGGGGGAGGLLAFTSQSLTATAYTCTVGGGGAAGTYTNTGIVSNRGSSGANSQFGSLTAAVGGGGGGGYNGWAGLTGGSGGGSDGGVPTGIGSGTSGQGYAGGQGFASSWAGGGGGGAGAVGANASANVGGNGGVGATSAFINSIGSATNIGELSAGNYYFAGGGGGCNTDNTAGNVGTGGLGGGARGTNNSQTTPPAGTVNTGGGGGGSRDSISPTYSLPSAGGSGVVIVRYAK